jgi:hypothetical protein
MLTEAPEVCLAKKHTPKPTPPFPISSSNYLRFKALISWFIFYLFHLCAGIYVCAYACVHVCVCVCVHPHSGIHRAWWQTFGCPARWLSLSLGDRVSHWTWGYIGSLACNPPVSVPYSTRVTGAHSYAQLFDMSAWDLNSSPYNRKQFYLLGYLLSSNTLYFPHGSTEPSTGPGPHAVQQVFFRQTISQPFFPLGMDLNTWLLPSQELEPSSL